MRHTSIIAAIGLALAMALSAAPAQAQLQHTFVSSTGLDTNNCSLATPCRHLQAALLATTAGGEIAILDSAGYNGGLTVFITKSVSIVNPGGFEAEIAPPSGGYGIVINAPATDAVSLRGLSIDGGGIGYIGIQFNSGASLTVENCVIRHVTNSGIDLSSNAASSFVVSNSLVADNGLNGIQTYASTSATATIVVNRVEADNNGGVGIYTSADVNGIVNATIVDSVAVNNAYGFVLYAGNVTMTRVTANSNQYGILVDGSSAPGPMNATVEDSAASHNSANGITVQSSGSVHPVVMVRNSDVSNNQNGLSSNPGGVMLLARTAVTGNSATGALLNGGPIYSYGDNNIDQNLNQVAGGTLTSILTR